MTRPDDDPAAVSSPSPWRMSCICKAPAVEKEEEEKDGALLLLLLLLQHEPQRQQQRLPGNQQVRHRAVRQAESARRCRLEASRREAEAEAAADGDGAVLVPTELTALFPVPLLLPRRPCRRRLRSSACLR